MSWQYESIQQLEDEIMESLEQIKELREERNQLRKELEHANSILEDFTQKYMEKLIRDKKWTRR